jgi:hypothetical protein
MKWFMWFCAAGFAVACILTFGFTNESLLPTLLCALAFMFAGGVLHGLGLLNESVDMLRRQISDANAELSEINDNVGRLSDSAVIARRAVERARSTEDDGR